MINLDCLVLADIVSYMSVFVENVSVIFVGSTVTTVVGVPSLSMGPKGIPVYDLIPSVDSLKSSVAATMTSMVSVPLELIAAMVVEPDGRQDSDG